MKVKLTFKEVVLLHDAHLNKEFPGSGPYYELLREHAADFVAFFQKIIYRAAARPTVTFTALQARAFMQLWVDQPLPANAGAYVILEMLKIFDQANKSVLILSR